MTVCRRVPSRFVSEFGVARSPPSRVLGQAARSIGCELSTNAPTGGRFDRAYTPTDGASSRPAFASPISTQSKYRKSSAPPCSATPVRLFLFALLPPMPNCSHLSSASRRRRLWSSSRLRRGSAAATLSTRRSRHCRAHSRPKTAAAQRSRKADGTSADRVRLPVVPQWPDTPPGGYVRIPVMADRHSI